MPGGRGKTAVERKTTMLVVDDEEDIVNLMRDFLEAEGYGVRTAHDGASALEILQSTPVDGVLLDVMMPGQSGFRGGPQDPGDARHPRALPECPPGG
jgi:response regulator RpfG family c-di-GMP phosphodiesterase